MSTALAAPVRYHRGIEQPEPDEAKAICDLRETMRKIVETTHGDGGHALRSVHAKSHGRVEGSVDVLPLPPELIALTGQALDPRKHPEGLREAVRAFFATQGGTWEIRVQRCTELERMPIKDASVVWPEAESPWRTVARLTVPPQPAWTDARADGGAAAGMRPRATVARDARPRPAVPTKMRGGE